MNLTERAQEIERLQAHNEELRETLSAQRGQADEIRIIAD